MGWCEFDVYKCNGDLHVYVLDSKYHHKNLGSIFSTENSKKYPELYQSALKLIEFKK